MKQHLNAVILVGRPGAGKTTYARKSLGRYKLIQVDGRKEEEVSRDIYNAVLSQQRFVLDGCNGNPATRSSLIEKVNYAFQVTSLANRRQVPAHTIDCHFLTTGLRSAITNLSERDGTPKDQILCKQLGYNRCFLFPDRSEGFRTVNVINFSPNTPTLLVRKALFFHLGSVSHLSTITTSWQSSVPIADVLEDVHEALKQYFVMGYMLIGLTNFEAIAEGRISHWDAQNRILDVIRNIQAPVDNILYCPHAKDGDCACRIPKPGLINQACEMYGIDLSKSILVGDSIAHRELAEHTGIKKYYHRANFFVAFKSLCQIR